MPIYRLPRLQDKARQRLHEMQTDLRSLPEPVTEPVKYMEALLWAFCQKVKEETDIHKFHNPLIVRACRKRLEEFDDTLVYHLFPRFRPFLHDSVDSEDASDYQEEHATSAEVPAITRSIQPPETIYLDQVMAKSEYVPLNSFFVYNTKTNITHSDRGREVPGNYPYGVKKEFMERSVVQWENETDAMLDDISYSIGARLQDIISEHFGAYQDGELAGHISYVSCAVDKISSQTHLDSFLEKSYGSMYSSCMTKQEMRSRCLKQEKRPILEFLAAPNSTLSIKSI
jgi:hypothetical protein